MCALEAHTTLLVWIFLCGAGAMAVLSRKLNDHLLVPPPPPKHIWFTKKNHIKPSYLMKPDLYFDRVGCQWAWRFTIVSAVSGLAFFVILYVITACK